MDVVKEIKDILAHPKPHEKDRGLERMNDVFEYGYGYDLKKEDIVEGVKLLLAAALQEQDPMMKRMIFRTLFKAVVFRQGKYLRRSNVNWDLLVDSLSSLNKWQFGYALDILGLTGQEKYVPVLDRYTHHIDAEVRDVALRAIKNIKVLAEYDANPQNEE